MKKKLIVPEDLIEITIEQYQYYARDLSEEMKPDALKFHAVNTLCSGDTDTIEHMSVNDIDKVGGHLLAILKEQKKVIYEFDIDGNKYALIPHMHEITTREYATLMEFIDQGQDANLHHVMAILYRPVIQRIGKRVRVSEEYYSEERAELFQKKLTMNVVQGVLLFFSAIITTYWSDSPTFSKEVEGALRKHTKQSGSDGTTSPTQQEGETLKK